MEPVPVEELERGDVVVLPNGRRVTVEYVESFDDGATLLVRWWRSAERNEAGWAGSGAFSVNDGRLLGSLIPVAPGHCWTVDRTASGGPRPSRQSAVLS
jgi:hypothetical protein